MCGNKVKLLNNKVVILTLTRHNGGMGYFIFTTAYSVASIAMIAWSNFMR